MEHAVGKYRGMRGLDRIKRKRDFFAGRKRAEADHEARAK